MTFETYLPEFQKAANKIDKKLLEKKRLDIATGITLDSAYLKLYKRSWTNLTQDPLTSESRIFFSLWVNESTLRENKLFYNIHALKLRKLKGYSIESRKFAEAFRAAFKKFKSKWPNVSTDFGPLTLMEGWVAIDKADLQDSIKYLVTGFLEIEQLVDKTLDKFK